MRRATSKRIITEREYTSVKQRKREKKPRPGRKYINFQCTISQEHYELLLKASQVQDVSRSEIVRAMLGVMENRLKELADKREAREGEC